MMEHKSLDPYEQQLLKVFDSYDYENRGSLDRDGLMQLCQTLQLEERGNDLIQCLLNDKKHTRATFVEFKEALLALLGNIQNTNDNASEFDGSPEREVSPKFVYGSKKYGRRSRPRNDEISPIKERNDVKYVNKTVHSVSVQRSNSQSDVMYSKKRKTNTNLKRCTSFPGNHLFENHRPEDTFVTSNNFANNHEFVCTESMLREAWKKLGVGEDGFLNQTELILVCDAIGLRKLANGVLRQLSDKLIGDFEHKISFQELLEALQQDEAWVDVLTSTPTNTEDTLSLNLSCLSSDSVFLNSKSVQFVTLGPKGNGYINIDTVVEMWESAGITSPRLLLNDLGFTSSDIDIVELASVLEKEIKGINEARSDFSNPHIALLQAILSLYQSEIRCLKNIMEQMQAEREKLKCDVAEANNRATLLAQEVDDNHAKMERHSQNQVKLLEQRHAEILKELTEHCSSEKDQLAVLNQNLKLRIAHLENEEAKLHNDLHLAQKYLASVEKENQNLSGQVSELEQVREVLNEQVRMLESEKQKHQETEQMQMETLIGKLSALQIENSRLRDKNDEMLSEIESLNAEMSVLRMKISNTSVSTNDNSMDDNIAVICEGVGHGSKRRSDDSPSKDLTVLGLGDESPRLGKVRKFHKNNEVLEIPFTSSESGFETELDCVDSSLSNSCNENEEIMRLQAKISVLEQILNDHSIPVPSGFSPQSEGDTALLTLKQTAKGADVKNILSEVKANVSKLLVTNQNCDVIRNINEKLNRLIEKIDKEVVASEKKQTNDANTETDADNERNVQQKLEQYAALNKVLSTECDELKNCLEMLENEYEKCEKYWASTLEEERKVFEQEQNQYSEHLGQLMQKISEFDEEFVRKDKRLPPIEEKCKLEEQFTDLEHEFEDYKELAEFQIDEKDREILDLKEQLEELTVKVKQTTEISVQTDYLEMVSFDMRNKKHNLSNHVIESTNLFPSDTMPFTLTVPNTSEHSSLVDHNVVPACDYVNSESLWNKEVLNNDSLSAVDNVTVDAQNSLEEPNATLSLPVNISFQTSQNDIKQSLSLYDLPCIPTEATCSGAQKNTIPLRPKRTRKHERNSLGQKLYKKNNSENNTQNNLSNMNQADTVNVPVSTIHNLNAKLHHLEQRCRHLQLVLKQQHYHAEQVLQHYWQQQRLEKSELQLLLKSTQEKLERQNRFCSEQFERLARTDLLVKDLYVENAFLVANVQRLEQKCHILTQCNSTNSV